MKTLICGICRNVAGSVEQVLTSIRSIQIDKDSDVFIYENDSTDNTVEIIKNANLKNLNLVSEHLDIDYNTISKDFRHLNRCNIIAKCRNVYMDYLKCNYKKYDYVIVVDMDLLDGFSSCPIGVAKTTFSNHKKAACVSAYGFISEPSNKRRLSESPGTYLMYDSLAYRYDCENITLQQQIQNNFVRHQNNAYKVLSNFNGIAVYKADILKDYKYSVEDPGIQYVVNCDHVMLHRYMRNDGHEIYIDGLIHAYYSRI